MNGTGGRRQTHSFFLPFFLPPPSHSTQLLFLLLFLPPPAKRERENEGIRLPLSLSSWHLEKRSLPPPSPPSLSLSSARSLLNFIKRSNLVFCVPPPPLPFHPPLFFRVFENERGRRGGLVEREKRKNASTTSKGGCGGKGNIFASSNAQRSMMSSCNQGIPKAGFSGGEACILGRITDFKIIIWRSRSTAF